MYGQPGIELMALDQLVAFVEAKETARAALAAPVVGSVSQFQKKKADPTSASQSGQKGVCQQCKKSFSLFKKMANGKLN